MQLFWVYCGVQVNIGCYESLPAGRLTIQVYRVAEVEKADSTVEQHHPTAINEFPKFLKSAQH
jgi:hypothetical protein